MAAAQLDGACAMLGTLGVRVTAADLAAAAKGLGKADSALLHALHDLALMHVAGWPVDVGVGDAERARVAATDADVLLFAQHHLRACGYSRADVYLVSARELGGTPNVGSRTRAFACAFAWLVSHTHALRIASERELRRVGAPLWPVDTADLPHNRHRAEEAAAAARARVDDGRRSVLHMLARAAGKPSQAGEEQPTLAEAIVSAAHTVLALLGMLHLALRGLISAHAWRARLIDRAQQVGLAARLPRAHATDAADAGARGGGAAPHGWTLFELWACTLGGAEHEDGATAAAEPAPRVAPASAPRAAHGVPADSGESEASAGARAGKGALKHALQALRASAEARRHERAFWRWALAVAAGPGGAQPARALSTRVGTDVPDSRMAHAAASRVEPPRTVSELCAALADEQRAAALELARHAPAAGTRAHSVEDLADARRVALLLQGAQPAAWRDARLAARANCETWPRPDTATGEQDARRPAEQQGSTARVLIGEAPLLPAVYALAAERQPHAADPGWRAEHTAEAELSHAMEGARELAETLAAERREHRDELSTLLEPLTSELACWGL